MNSFREEFPCLRKHTTTNAILVQLLTGCEYLLGTVHDIVHCVSSLTCKKQDAETDSRALLEFSDDEVVAMCSKSNIYQYEGHSDIFSRPVYAISSTAIIKAGSHVFRWEAQAMNLVRSQTSIPVPRPLRFFTRGDDGYLVMELIKGRSLYKCWTTLSLWQKLRIAWTLRGYVHQLRQIRTPQIDAQVPGPITDDPTVPLKCSSLLCGNYCLGPFATKQELAEWMNLIGRTLKALEPEMAEVPPFREDEPLVFTHGDLNLRNIILGDDGRLWLIDWGMSGVYPRWLEVGGMVFQAIKPRFWTLAGRFAAGHYEDQERLPSAACYFMDWYGRELGL